MIQSSKSQTGFLLVSRPAAHPDWSGCGPAMFGALKFVRFGFASDFVLRISDLAAPPSQTPPAIEETER